MGRKINGTKHIRRKPRKGAIIAGISAIVIAAIATLGAFIYQGKISMPKLREDKSIISKSISVENEENLFILGGTGSAGSMIMVNPLLPENGTIDGTGGSLDKTGSLASPESSSNYLSFSANPATSYLFDKWEIYNNSSDKIGEAKSRDIRIYYYDDPSMIGEYNGDGFKAYITNQSINLKPVFKERIPVGDALGESSGQRYLTCITSPNVGYVEMWVWAKEDANTGWMVSGRTGYLYKHYGEDIRRVSIWNQVNDAEKTQFYGEDPRFDLYTFQNSKRIDFRGDLKAGVLTDGRIALDPGEYTFVIVPHLKTGYLDEAVTHVEPDSTWGSATWNGSQVIAEPSEGYMFDHWEWYSQNQLQKSTDSTMPAKPTGVVLYTAFFKKAQYKVDIAGITPQNAGTVSGTGTFAKGTDVKLSVTPKPGYVFKDATWTTENGIYHHAADVKTEKGVTTFTVPKVEEDIYVTIEFDTTKFTLEAKSDPSSYGTVKVENTTNPSSAGPLVKEDFAPGDAAKLTATPNTGNVFLYWEDSNGNRYDNAELKFDQVYMSETFTAHFAKEEVQFTVKATDSSVKATVNYEDKSGNLKSATLDPGQSVGIKPDSNVTVSVDDSYIDATNNTVMKFSNFTNDEGKSFTDNPLVVTNITKDVTYTANYVPEKYTVSIAPRPIGSGSPTIEVDGVDRGDSVLVKHGQQITLKAGTNSGYDFLFFEDSQGNKINNPTFNALSGQNTYYAVAAPSTVDVKVTPTRDGDINMYYISDDGSKTNRLIKKESDPIVVKIKGGTSVTFEVTPASGKTLSKFVDVIDTTHTKDYPASTGTNSVRIDSIVQDMSVTPVYDSIRYQIGYVISPANGGSVTLIDKSDQDKPLDGNPAYAVEGHNIELKAEPKDGSGYTFMYFKDSQGNKYKSGDKITALGNETFTAYFVKGTLGMTIELEPGLEAGSVITSYTPINGGNRNVNYLFIDDIQSNTNVKLTATPKSGYEFAGFVDRDNPGTTIEDNPYTIVNYTTSKDIVAKFEKSKCKIYLRVNPDTGGIINNSEGGGYIDAEYGKEYSFEAAPNDGYSFMYFMDSKQNKYRGTEIIGTSATKPRYRLSVKALNSEETYTAVFGMSNVTVNVKIAPTTTDSDGASYLAGGYSVSYTRTDGTPVQTGVFYKEMTFTDVKGLENFEINAVPKDGYKFEEFKDTDGGATTDNPLIYSPIDQNRNVTITFVPDEADIKAVASPEMGGVVTVNGRVGEQKVQTGQPVEILAKPNDGYTFKCFKDSTGNEFTTNPLTFNAINGSETYTAYFVKSELSVTIDLMPSEYGTVRLNNNADVSAKTTYPIDGRSNVTLTATPNEGKNFVYWKDQDGNTYNDNPLNIVDVSKNMTFTAIFAPNEITITGVASPEMGGTVTVNDFTGSKKVTFGDEVTLRATAADGYKFKYFKDSAGNQFVSNPLNFKAVNGSETYTAYFVKEEVTVTIDLTPSGSGTVRFNDEPAVSKRTTYTTDGRSNVRLTAMAKEGKEFVYWKDQDGNQYPDNPLTIVDISKDLVFTAVFDGEVTGIRAVASPASGGRIQKIVNDNGSITLIATPNKGYTFANWKKGDKLLTLGTKYVVKAADVHDGDVYTAYFKYNPNYDAKSDITKEKFYREWRRVVTPNYTVTRDSMKLLAMQTVAGLRQYDDATPDLRSYGAVANAQAYFDERVAKDIQRLDGIFGDSELMTVEGEILPPDLLPDFTVYEEIAKEFTDKKFGKHYDTEILTVKRVLQPENFDNVNRTYLWRYTGAEFKDNIYLLYDINGKKPKWVSPIVDPDGVLKFTIKELQDEDVVAVVRVTIKK